MCVLVGNSILPSGPKNPAFVYNIDDDRVFEIVFPLLLLLVVAVFGHGLLSLLAFLANILARSLFLSVFIHKESSAYIV